MKSYKKTIICIIILLCINLFPKITADDGDNAINMECIVNHIDQTTIKIFININDFQFSTTSNNQQEYTIIDLYNQGQSINEGQAKLPKIRKMIEIPQESTPIVTIDEVIWEETSLQDLQMPFHIIPAQPFYEKTDDQIDFIIDNDYYNIDYFYPQNIAEVIEIQQIRGRRFALIEINPVQYKPSNGYMRLMETSEITIDLQNCDFEKTETLINRYYSQDFEDVYKQIFNNYGFYEADKDSTKESVGYLIIVHDTFIEEITPFADWKTTLGYNTTLTKTSEIPGGITTNTIKTYIEEAYNTWSMPPSYILLVGDTAQIPAFTSDGGVTDTPFVTIDGDNFQDIYIGRFPASTETHVETMVEKTIYYETGDFPNTEWIKKAVFLASVDNYDISEGTHNYVIDTHLEPNGYSCDKLYQVSYGATTQDVRDSLNDGRSLVIFSGHGSTTSWSDGPSFSQSNVNGLTNDGMYPFVCSHSCLTGKFSVSECFGETWLRTPNKGGIAFWGSSINTQWDPDDIIERRVFDAWWNLDLTRIGQMTDKGMYDAYLEYGSVMIKFVKSYNVLGDASIQIWRDEVLDYDIIQDVYDRGFPIRHAIDGDWAAAQSFKPNSNTILGVDVYLRKFGNPEFNLNVELRENDPQGILIDTISFTPTETPNSWTWLNVDFIDTEVTLGVDYFIVIPPAPSGVTTSFGYEWCYAFGDKYNDGSFWFTRDGGGLWRDLPDSYEFTFRTM